MRKSRHYKDITIKIDLSSDDKKDLDKVCQEIIKNINIATIKSVDKLTKKTLIKKGKDITIDNIESTIFPKN